jgi:hypothetical protein
MIGFKKHKDIDKEKWDACITASANDSIFVLSWYLDIVCQDWSALVLNDYEAVFPLAPRSKYKISYLYQPYFTRYFGVFGKQASGSENDFLKSIPDQFRFIEFCLHENSIFSDESYKVRERKYQLLELNAEYEKLYENYSDNSKRNIKKALKKEFNIRKGISPFEIVNLFKNTKGGELEIFKAKDYQTLINLMEACMKMNCAESIAVYNKEEQLTAAAFFMKHGSRYVFLKSGVTEPGKAHGAMHLLMDSFIKEHAGQNKILDFGGSSVETVARFYRNFGAKDCLYLQVNKNKLPGLVNWMKSLKN